MEENTLNWVFQFFGRLHPLIVHFPIGLLVVGLFLELLTLGKKRKGLREGITYMVYIGAAFSITAALFGWLLRTNEAYAGELVDFHQKMGIATAVLAGISASILYVTLRGKIKNYLPYRLGLFLTVITLTIAGHLGANLTHGEDYLTSVLPGNQEEGYDDSKGVALWAQLKPLDSLTELQQDDLNLEVRAIVVHNCVQCHSDNKKKGELVLETKEGVFKGGESGAVIVSGKPDESELYKRITRSPDEEGVMPKKGKTLKKHEISLVKLWIEKGAYWSDKTLKIFPEAELALNRPALPEKSTENHPIDKIVDAYFEKNAIDWPETVDDRIFIRRAYLDIIGLIPEPKEISAFKTDTDPDKRKKLIDNLLNDSENYTQHWLSFWNDLLRNDYSGTGYLTKGRKQITDWLYTSLEENKPYDLMVKELVNPTPVSEGFIKGIQWRGVVNSSQSIEMQAAQNIGQSLLGVNVKCASCHNSFVSNLTLAETYGFASIFSDTLMEQHRCDKPIGKMAKPGFLYPELGDVEAETVEERLLKLAEVIVKPENGRLYRTMTNRIWKRLMGRGIVEPVDEMDNAPWNASLLDWMAADFIESGHDLKALMRTIMTSKTYQLANVDFDKIDDVKSKQYVFTGPVTRRMSAEQFSDVVSQVIAPMYYGMAYDPTGNELSSRRVWHPEIKFDRDVLPDPGKRYFRYVFSLSKKEIASAHTLISVDNSYLLFINDEKVSEGNDWRKVDRFDIKPFLRPGKNVIAVEGTNEGNIAKPAGVLFATKLKFANGSEQLIQTNEEWKSTEQQPGKNWGNADYDDLTWSKVRDFGSSHWDKLVAFTFDDDRGEFARASLVRQHPFMKALGRPSRENVTTTRDEQATLLQALELTNGAYFNTVLEEGADLWLTEYGHDSERIAETLYRRTFGRDPTTGEKNVMLATLGDTAEKETVQDLFWTTLMLPEFQFIQ